MSEKDKSEIEKKALELRRAYAREHARKVRATPEGRAKQAESLKRYWEKKAIALMESDSNGSANE